MSLPLLIPALQDFERSPGRYPLVKREPSLLFDHAHTVLLLAAGRSVEGLELLGTDEQTQARRAARFFVRAALLRSGVDHFTLLGLLPGANAEQVREHYRLMIRLTHPDFAADGEPWPADAASRINIANDVLSSPEKRADYEATLAHLAAPAPLPSASLRRVPGHRPAHLNERAPTRVGLWTSSRVKFAVAGVGALICGGVLVLMGPTGSESSLAARPQAPMASPVPTLKLSASLDEAPDATSLSGRASAKEILVPSPVLAPEAKRTASAAPTKTTPLALAKPAGSPPPSTEPARPEVVANAAPPVTSAAAPEPEPVALTMRDVHPTLTHLINGLQSGDAAAMARAIGPDWRQTAANEAFVQKMGQWLAGHKVTQLDNLLFTARAQGATLVVDGKVDVSSNDSGQQLRQRELHLRAVFTPQDGRPVLTLLAASPR